MRLRLLEGDRSKVYELDEGVPVSDCFNETLDSATVKISNQSEQLEFEPYDLVCLEDSNLEDKYFLIDSFEETMVCLDPYIYNYEIHLFSETKELENYILPNKKITKVWGQSRSIVYYIREYLNEYGPKIRVVDGDSYKWVNKYTLSSELYQKFNAIECPEMQWNKPTLREVLNDLLMVGDCIVTIKRDYTGRQPFIDFLDLTQERDINKLTGEEKTKYLSHINYITSSKSSEDYVSELKCELVNVTNPRKDSINTVVTKTEWCHITNDEDLITSDNWYVETQYPIYKIKSLKMFVYVGHYRGWEDAGGGQTNMIFDRRGWISFDLTNCDLVDRINGNTHTQLYSNVNLVYEYKEWQTKRTKYTLTTGLSYVSVADYPDYKNYTVYYVRGDNKIQNFTSISEKYITGDTKQLYDVLDLPLLRGYLVKKYGDLYYDFSDPSEHYELRFFAIEYETLENATFTASKAEYPKHTRVVIDNQTNSYIDSENQGFLEYQKANRLGNLQKMINARYEEDFDLMLKIGDKIGDYVIYQTQYQVFEDHVEVNALATKHYVLRDYFTGVKSKIRSWKISDGSEALTRHDLVKYYLEFSFINRENDNELLEYASGVNLPMYFLTPLQDADIQPLKYVALKTKSNNTYYPSGTNYYAIDLISRIVGNSLVFTFGLKDNYWAGTAFDNNEITYSNTLLITGMTKISGGYPVEYYRYANDDGENDEIIYDLTYQMKNNNEYTEIESDSDQNLYADTAINRHFVISSVYKPKVDIAAFSDYKIQHFVLNQHKDSQEITSISTQFELCSETTDIMFSKLFIERQQAIKMVKDTNFNLLFYTGPSINYNFKNPDLTGIEEISLQLHIEDVSANKAYIDIIDNTSSIWRQAAYNHLYNAIFDKTIYIFYKNNQNLLMAVNNGSNHILTIHNPLDDKYTARIRIYLNILRDRNKSVYGSQANQIFIKEI